MVQTPGLDEGNAKYGMHEALWASVTVPGGLKAMVSFTFLHVQGNLRFRCRPNAIELYKGGTGSKDKLWTTCGFSPPAIQVMESDVYHVHFKTGSKKIDRFEGFRLHFSFHKVVCFIIPDPPVYSYLILSSGGRIFFS